MKYGEVFDQNESTRHIKCAVFSSGFALKRGERTACQEQTAGAHAAPPVLQSESESTSVWVDGKRWEECVLIGHVWVVSAFGQGYLGKVDANILGASQRGLPTQMGTGVMSIRIGSVWVPEVQEVQSLWGPCGVADGRQPRQWLDALHQHPIAA